MEGKTSLFLFYQHTRMQWLHTVTQLFNLKRKKGVGKVWKELQQPVVGTRTAPQPSLNRGWQDRSSSTSQRKPGCRKPHINSCQREPALTDMAPAQAGVRQTDRKRRWCNTCQWLGRRATFPRSAHASPSILLFFHRQAFPHQPSSVSWPDPTSLCSAFPFA